MFIEITIKTEAGQADIRIDSNQRINEGLHILNQRGILKSKVTPDYFRSAMNQNLVSAYKTFEEENIFDGDILTAIELV